MILLVGSHIQIHRYTDTQIHRYTDTQNMHYRNTETQIYRICIYRNTDDKRK